MASTAFRPRWRRPARCASTSDEDQKTIRGIVFLRNKYSVISIAVGRPVDVHAYADRIVIRQDGIIVGEHARIFGRGQTAYDPWHYVPVLARKPGALRNGAPFKDWVLPPAMAAIRRKLKGGDDGDRQMVQILSCVRDDGLQAVEAACREALDQGVHSAPVVINILARSRDHAPAILAFHPRNPAPDRMHRCADQPVRRAPQGILRQAAAELGRAHRRRQ